MSEFTKKSTLDLQMTSLCNFMSQLSYHFNPFKGCFISSEPQAIAQGKPRLSFATAVQMHNGGVSWMGWVATRDGHVVYEPSGLKLPLYNYKLASAAKIVTDVKLQFSKKADFPVQVQSDMVRFEDLRYAEFFGFKEEE